jgi:hypothetical protein
MRLISFVIHAGHFTSHTSLDPRKNTASKCRKKSSPLTTLTSRATPYLKTAVFSCAKDNLDASIDLPYFSFKMKSCFSILVALIIIVVFAGTAGLLWYGSKTTEFKKGQDAETMERSMEH